MATVDADFLIRLTANRETGTPTGTAREDHTFDVLKTYAASASYEVFSASGALSDSGTKSYNLTDLGQEDSTGNEIRSDISFSKVLALAVRNTKPGSGGTLRIGGAASYPWAGDDTPFATGADLLCVPRSASLVWISPDGGAVSSSSKNILIEAASAQEFEILIVGES